MSVTPRWLLVNSTVEFPKFKIHGFCQHPQSNSRGLLIPLHAPCTTEHGPGVTAPKPPSSNSHGKQGSPPSSRGTVHAQGVKSWGDRFIGAGFCLGTSVNQLERFYLKRMKVSKKKRENLNRFESTE